MEKPISGIESSTASLSVKGEGKGKGQGKSVKALIVPEKFDSPLAGLVKINFGDIDEWYEEQSRVIYHPKDPFHRVDCLPTGRRVKVEVDGVVVADTGDEGGIVSLWETGFPARWYLPRTSVKWEYLRESEKTTGCPYKGEASYYDLVVEGKEIKDAVWWYKSPLRESLPIEGLVSTIPPRCC